ncbi:uncharacterized protein [Dendrobates tinctorius]|uniref:uncharacterized protein n=1 Tax=Dendrobates tinctorius TaxID=92724 RepID=UPI003CC9FB3D
MAVVYADLRFTRALRQDPGVTKEQEDENCAITYENVTIPKARDQTQSLRTCPRDLQALPHYLTITLILLSCALTAVVIGLSLRLSQVSDLQHHTEAELQQLQGVHEELGSRFTQDNSRKDSMIAMLNENQKHCQRELEKTSSSLYQVQNKWKLTTQEMERIVREKENTETTLRRLQDNLQSTKTQLEGKQEELSRCENNLRLVNTQKKTSETTLTHTRNSLSMTQAKLKGKENDLVIKDRELSSVKKSLWEAQKNLEEKKRDSDEQEKKLTDLDERLRDAGNCLSSKGKNAADSIEYCPPGWHQIGELCYYLSTQKKSRISALDDCEKRSATLAKVGDERSTLTELIRRKDGNYWIGLYKNNGFWEWPDGTIKTDLQVRSPQVCVKAGPLLSPESCRTALPWICEMRTKTSSSKTEVLRCMGEKIRLFGENHEEQ